jgi:hypothetical protein
VRRAFTVVSPVVLRPGIEVGTIPAMRIPFFDAGTAGAPALAEAFPDETRAVLATALGAHPLLPRVARLGDTVSRRWLERHGNPYRGEIDAIARRIDRPGVYLLNCIYEWACSTSAGPDPEGVGSRMVRILDWGMKGIGRYVIVARHEAEAGAYFAVTWPGYAGVITAMAPGRFVVALNQAPQQCLTRVPVANDIAIRLRMLRRGGIPAPHLLRRLCETARNFEDAVAQLMLPHPVSMPALVTLSGARPEDAAVVELRDRDRVLHRAQPETGWIVGVANDWLSDWPGQPRLHAHVRRPGETPRGNNAERRHLICALQSKAFAGAASLPVPLINAHTVLVAIANAGRGSLQVEALDLVDDLPRVVAATELVA